MCDDLDNNLGALFLKGISSIKVERDSEAWNCLKVRAQKNKLKTMKVVESDHYLN